LPKPDRSTAAPVEPHVWRLPNEAPGTLREIFDAEDSRRQNLVLCAFRKVDGFRRCWTAIGKQGDPYRLIDAVMTCISWHLNPIDRLAEHRRRMRMAANRANAAAFALQELSTSIDQIGRDGWLLRLKGTGLPDPTDPRIIADLHNLGAGLDRMLARGAFRDEGGRPKMLAFARLIQSLARVFEDSTGERAGLTLNQHADPPRYEGRFWDLVEIVRPIVAEIIARSRTGAFAEPNSGRARGKFIERMLARTAMDKTPAC
jgi:hypothetical protein